jgi:hypothetical protein
VLAYNHVFILVAALFVITLPLVALLRRGTADPDAEIVAD